MLLVINGAKFVACWLASTWLRVEKSSKRWEVGCPFIGIGRRKAGGSESLNGTRFSGSIRSFQPFTKFPVVVNKLEPEYQIQRANNEAEVGQPTTKDSLEPRLSRILPQS